MPHESRTLFNAAGGEKAAWNTFEQAVAGGKPINKATYDGLAYNVNGRFVGFRYNDGGVPTIDYGGVRGVADPFRIHFPTG